VCVPPLGGFGSTLFQRASMRASWRPPFDIADRSVAQPELGPSNTCCTFTP
jgi:hypothetical protein